MNLGLGHQQLSTRLEADVDLAQQSALIRHFVDHHEGQGEVGLGIDAQAVLLALTGLNPVGHARLLRSPPQHVEHLLLKIDGDHPAAVADNLGHRQGKHPHPAAHVQDGHSRPDVGADDLLWIVEQAAQWVVDEVTAPPGANVWHGGPPKAD